MSKTVVGTFRSVSDAEKARQELLSQGYSSENIRIVADQQGNTGSNEYSSRSDTSTTTHESGVLGSIKHFFASLSGADETDQGYYSQGVTSGGAILSATVPDEQAQSARALLEQYGASEFEGQVSGRSRSAGVGSNANAGNVAIPVVEEELQIGKRQVSRGGVRVYSHVTETPVEENVRLREEHVRVQRHAVDRPASEADFRAFKEGAIELTETAEEAVVAKYARVVEEVVIGKEVSERTQTVRDSVRRTDVEVEEIAPELERKTTTSGL